MSRMTIASRSMVRTNRLQFLPRALVSGAALVAAACGLGKEGPPPPSPGSVFFEIEPVDARDKARLGWLATFRSDGRVASFRIELLPEEKGATLPAFVRCSLHREPGSDGAILVEALAAALGGSAPPPGPGVLGIEATSVILARDLSRGGKGNQVAGIFGSEPKGSWISTKLFLSEAEIFLNLDPVSGYGEFSIKDETYTSDVLRVLGRLFQGEAREGVVDLDPAPVEGPAEIAETPAATPSPEPTPSREQVRVLALMEKAGPGRTQGERIKAFDELARMGGVAKSAAPVFVAGLRDMNEMTRGAALRGFASIRPDPLPAIDAVRPLLKDSFLVNQALAASALADFGQPQEAAAHLTLLLKTNASTWAAAGLMRIGAHAAPAVPALTEMLEGSQSAGVGYAACMALAAIGRPASPALPALRRASAAAEPSVSQAAVYAIKQIEGR